MTATHSPSAIATPRRPSLRLGAAIVALFWLACYILPLGIRPLLRPDEFRYAEIPREMAESGDFFHPRLIGMPYYEKPPLGYQAIALSMRLFGENAFALRLPSALASGIAAAMVFLLLAARTDDRRLPPLAAGCYLAGGLAYGVGTFAVLDAPLTAALTAAMAFLYLSDTARSRRAALLWMALAGAAAGVAFLVKGFLGLVIPAIVLFPYALWQRRFLALLRNAWAALLALLLVAVPPSVVLHLHAPGFWRYFILVEHFARFTSATGDKNPQPFWFFVPHMLLGPLPPVLLFLATRAAWTRAFFRNPLVRFALCWCWMPFFFFSASSCKLGTYILPCFPALSILLAHAFCAAFDAAPDAVCRAVRRIFTGLGCFFLAIAIAGAVFFALHPVGLNGPFWALLALVLLALFAGALVAAARRRLPPARLFVLYLAGFAVCLPPALKALDGGILAESAPERDFLTALARFPVAPDDVLVSDTHSFQTVAWTLRRNDLHLIGTGGELKYAIANDPACAARHVTDFPAFLAATTPGKRVRISCEGPDRLRLPPDIDVVDQWITPTVCLVRF